MEYLVIGYIVGFFISVIILKFLGKALDFDYDEPKNYVNQDDWSSNSQAYTAFSLTWPIFWTITLIGLLWNGLHYVVKIILK